MIGNHDYPQGYYGDIEITGIGIEPATISDVGDGPTDLGASSHRPPKRRRLSTLAPCDVLDLRQRVHWLYRIGQVERLVIGWTERQTELTYRLGNGAGHPDVVTLFDAEGTATITLSIDDEGHLSVLV